MVFQHSYTNRAARNLTKRTFSMRFKKRWLVSWFAVLPETQPRNHHSAVLSSTVLSKMYREIPNDFFYVV